MTATLTRPAPTRHSGGASGLAARVARRIGCTPATAEQKLWGNSRMTMDELATAVEECVAAGRSDVADRLTRKVTAALAQAPAVPLTVAALAARTAEAAEAVSETRFLLEHTDAALAADLNDVERARRALETYRLALVAEQQRRKA